MMPGVAFLALPISAACRVLQTVALQRAHHEQDDDEHRHASIRHKGFAKGGQESVDAEAAHQGGHDGGDEDDEDGVKLQCEADDDYGDAKQYQIVHVPSFSSLNGDSSDDKSSTIHDESGLGAHLPDSPTVRRHWNEGT